MQYLSIRSLTDQLTRTYVNTGTALRAGRKVKLPNPHGEGEGFVIGEVVEAVDQPETEVPEILGTLDPQEGKLAGAASGTGLLTAGEPDQSPPVDFDRVVRDAPRLDE